MPPRGFEETAPLANASTSPLIREALKAAVLQPVVPNLPAANDNDEPEPPPALAALIPRIGPSFLFGVSFAPAFSIAAA